jgi:RNA polymerase sigma-70 factor, ECF subfamily
MARFLAGDGAAFDALYRVMAPRLRAFFRRRTRDDGVADDLVQETLLRAYAARDGFAPQADVVSWVFAIARHLFIDRGRARVLRLQPLGAESESFAPRPDAVLEAKETARFYLGALARLPEDQRAAFELVRQQGLSVAEAAERLGTTRSAVKLRTFRASRALRGELAR